MAGAALIDPASAVVTALTPGEVRLLDVLVDRAPAVVPKAALVEDGADTRAAEASVARLQGKLGELGAAIRTVPGAATSARSRSRRPGRTRCPHLRDPRAPGEPPPTTGH